MVSTGWYRVQKSQGFHQIMSHLATWTTLFNHDLNRICPMHDSSVIDCDLDSTPRRVICMSHSNLDAKKRTLDKIVQNQVISTPCFRSHTKPISVGEMVNMGYLPLKPVSLLKDFLEQPEITKLKQIWIQKTINLCQYLK